MRLVTDVVAALLARIERYYDAVPRAAARAEDHGPLTLFVRRERGWPYYARPRLHPPAPVDAADVTAVRKRQRELGVPESFEWVHDVTPSLAPAAEAAGLAVHSHPLMVLDPGARQQVTVPDGTGVRLIDPDAPDLPTVLAVPKVAFGSPGTAIGAPGRPELATAAANPDPDALNSARGRIRAGLTVLAAAYDDEGPLAAGMHQPVAEVTEIVGVGTLPAARRRGLGVAVTDLLADHALRNGAELVFLSASDDAVARMYGRAGFHRIGTAMIAGPPAG